MRLITYIKNNYRNLLFAFAINLVLLILILLIFSPIFDTNDDIYIRSFITGEYGLYDYHIVYSNILFGYMFMFLYKISHLIPWYEIIYYFFIYISLSFITYIILNKGKCVYLFLLVLLYFSIDLYVKFQYTKVASILAISGGLMLINIIIKEDNNKLFTFFGIILIVLGFMVRVKQCLACLSIEICFCIPYYKKMLTKKNMLICLLIIFLCGLCYYVDKKSYSNKEYQEYLSFNYLRTNLLDGGFPDYTYNYKKIHDDLFITENAYSLYWLWDFNDPEHFTIPVMEELINLKNDDNLIHLLKFDYYFKYICNNIFILILIVFVAEMGIRRNKYLISILLSLLCFLCLLFCALLLKPVLDDRVVIPIIFELYVLLFYIDNPFGFLVNNKKIISIFCIVFIPIIFDFVMINTNYGSEFRLLNKDKSVNEKYIESTNKDNVYFVSTTCDPISYKLFDYIDAGSYSNKIMLGGWQTNHPMFIQLEKNNDVSNPYIDLIEKENAYLIANQKLCNLIISYLEDYHCPKVSYEKIDCIENDVCIYKINKIK